MSNLLTIHVHKLWLLAHADLSHNVAPERTLRAHLFPPPVPREFRSTLLLRLRTERHHSSPQL